LPWCFDKGIRPALREYCARQKWSITSEYVDHETGGTSRRKHFQQMMTDASVAASGRLVRSQPKRGLGGAIFGMVRGDATRN
jgi:hypothetical protein